MQSRSLDGCKTASARAHTHTRLHVPPSPALVHRGGTRCTRDALSRARDALVRRGGHLEHGEAGVDLRRLPPPRRVVPRRVPRVLRPGQVHQLQHRLRPFPAAAAAGGVDVDAADGVGAGGVRVGAGGGRGAQRGGAAGEAEELAGRGDGDLPVPSMD